MIRILLVDDHVLFREGTRVLLAAAADIEVVAECGDGEVAWDAIQATAPDVVLLDIRLEGTSGIEIARRLNSRRSPAKVLILTAYPYETYVRKLFAAGVHGYLLKKASGPELIEAVRAVHRGEQVIGRGISFRDPAMTRHADTAAGTAELSEREIDVLSLVQDGASNREIAEHLNIGVRTVESHVSHAMAKLGARSRTQALNLAHQLGVIGKE
jgi:DNA-binding NarL/FixJ family response regulator